MTPLARDHAAIYPWYHSGDASWRAAVDFFFSSRRRHTRWTGDLEFRRVLFRSPRGRWTVLAVGVGAQGAFAAYNQGLPALGPALQAQFRVGLTQTGVLLASVSAGVLVTLYAWGLLTDRVGERPVLAAGLAGAAGMLVVAAFVRGFWPLAAALVGAGMLGACSNAATGRAVMGWFGRGERGTALGIRQMATPLGGGVAALTLPALTGYGGLRTALLALAVCALAAAVASALWIRTPPRVEDEVLPKAGRAPGAPEAGEAAGASAGAGAAVAVGAAAGPADLAAGDRWRAAGGGPAQPGRLPDAVPARPPGMVGGRRRRHAGGGAARRGAGP